jgi:hypothetical protein
MEQEHGNGFSTPNLRKTCEYMEIGTITKERIGISTKAPFGALELEIGVSCPQFLSEA